MANVNYSKLNILLIDDNQHMRSILTAIFRAIGVKSIVEASDGADGLQLLQTQSFDVVFADINMQPIDGIEFLTMLRRSQDSRSPNVPVIMISGHTERRRVELARDAGANEFVAKPISAQVLLARLASVVERPREFVRGAAYVGPDRRRRMDIGGSPGRRLGDHHPEG